MRAKNIFLVAGVFLALIMALVLLGRSYLRPFIFQFAMPTDYFESERIKPDEFLEVAGNIYAFRHGFNRSLVIDAGEKLAVFDTFNGEHSSALKRVLDKKFPGKKVGWVFYSHHHLDHIRGAGELAPEVVIAHRDVTSYVQDFAYVRDVLPVTLPVEGDTDLVIGNTQVKMLYFPRSHSETLYAFHFPSEKVLFLPDLMFKDAVPPFGFPDWYYPGYIRALDHLLTINADHYVPTHFDTGTRDDLLSYRDMMVDFREEVLGAFSEYDYDAADGERLREVLKKVYPILAKKHGHRIGFDAMFIPHFGRQVGGIYLGF
jgi:glyoxylase-like metal-dependent hydrolase (beta-lactamase superfamily II)